MEPPVLPPPMPPPMPGERAHTDAHMPHESEDPIYDWDEARLDTLDNEVYVNIAARIHSLE